MDGKRHIDNLDTRTTAQIQRVLRETPMPNASCSFLLTENTHGPVRTAPLNTVCTTSAPNRSCSGDCARRTSQPRRRSSNTAPHDTKNLTADKRCKTAGKTFGRTSAKPGSGALPPIIPQNPYTVPAYFDNRKVLFKTQKLKKSNTKNLTKQRKITHDKTIYNVDILHNDVEINIDILEGNNDNKPSVKQDSDRNTFYKTPKPPETKQPNMLLSRRIHLSCSLSEKNDESELLKEEEEEQEEQEEEMIDKTLFEFSDD